MTNQNRCNLTLLALIGFRHTILQFPPFHLISIFEVYGVQYTSLIYFNLFITFYFLEINFINFNQYFRMHFLYKKIIIYSTFSIIFKNTSNI